MAPIRKRAHIWTNFEQHTLLCLLCRQIQLTGTSSPTQVRKGGRTKAVFSLPNFKKHAHRDVADLLNRSLNYGNHEHDIPAEEVSAEIDRLMEERKDAVGFMERQRVGRITRAMKRVWERGAKVGEWADAENVRGGKRPSSATAANQGESTGVVNDSDGQVDAQMADAEDPWGDKVAASATVTQIDPWGDDVMTSVAGVQGGGDPWGEEPLIASNADVQDATDPWGSAVSTVIKTITSTANVQDASDPWDFTEPTFADKTTSNDPWGFTESTLVDTTLPDDLWVSWTSTVPLGTNTNTLDDSWAPRTSSDDAHTNTPSQAIGPWTDISSAFPSTTESDFISSQIQTQSITSISATTAPGSPFKQKSIQKDAFSGLNSARLAMLNGGDDDFEQEAVIEQPTYASKGKGENAVELPFNRLARMHEAKETGEMKKIRDDEMDISEEE